MARNFRLYEKKRGNRRTGSRKLGSAGEALFFAVFFVLGCGGLVVLFATLVFPEWRAAHEFVQHKCLVLDKQIGQTQRDDGSVYRPEIRIEYEIDGVTYRQWTYDIWSYEADDGYSPGRDDKLAVLDRFSIGQQCDCWYDPADPNVAVLVRGYRWWVWLTFIVPLSFILIGGGGLVHTVFTWGKSAERRAAFAKRAANLDPFATNGRPKPNFPNIPLDTNITNSPGTTLAFRLPVATSPAWALFVLLMACLFWNALVCVFVIIAVGSFLAGNPDWFLTIFISPFVLIGVGLIVFFFRQLLVTTGIGPTLVEISDQPLYPGKRYRLFVSQTGRLKISSLEVWLACEEEATYRHGTDTRTETRRVYQQPVFRLEEFEVRRGLPFETDCEVEIPIGAMHSFKSDHNEVTWKLVVKGKTSGWPEYERSFPVIVYPCRNGKSEA